MREFYLPTKAYCAKHEEEFSEKRKIQLITRRIVGFLLSIMKRDESIEPSEKEYPSEVVDRIWVGFDKLVERLSHLEGVNPQILLESALVLLKPSSPFDLIPKGIPEGFDDQLFRSYCANAGLTILGCPSVVQHIVDNNMVGSPDSSDSLIYSVINFIPNLSELEQMGLNDMNFYNFIRATEFLLQVIEVIQESLVEGSAEAETTLQQQLGTISQIINTRILPPHQEALRTACQAPDMKGTLVKKYYSEENLKPA